jgi:hypothetical protein
MIRRKSTSTTAGIWILTIFCSIFIGVGVTILVSSYLLPYWALVRSSSWPQTQAVMDSIKIAESRGDDSTSYYPKAEYHYTVDDVMYRGSLFWFGQRNSINKRSLVEDATKAFSAGDEFLLYYNPSNPSESVVVRQIAPGSWFIAALASVFIAFPLVFVYAAISASAKAKKPTPALGGAPLSLAGTKRADSLAFHSETCPNEIDDPHNNQPYMVKPTTNQLNNAIGLFIFGTIWNGFVVIFGYGVVFKAGGFNWLPALFTGGFLLAGIGIFCGAIYCLLASFNPKPTVVCSQSQIYPGSEFEISWTFAGNTGRIKSLKLSLTCSETVTYRAGTDTRTETKVLSEDMLFESSDPNTFAEGFALTKLPYTSMHTFKSPNNEVKWTVKLEGDIPMWPNLSEVFDIKVYPPPIADSASTKANEEVLA